MGDRKTSEDRIDATLAPAEILCAADGTPQSVRVHGTIIPLSSFGAMVLELEAHRLLAELLRGQLRLAIMQYHELVMDRFVRSNPPALTIARNLVADTIKGQVIETIAEPLNSSVLGRDGELMLSLPVPVAEKGIRHARPDGGDIAVDPGVAQDPGSAE